MSLKYHRTTSSGCKDIGIIISYYNFTIYFQMLELLTVIFKFSKIKEKCLNEERQYVDSSSLNFS